MATRSDVVNVARGYLRDFPKFFQLSFPPAGRTYDLGKPNISKDSLWVGYIPTGGGASVVLSPSDYSVDERSGLIRLNTLPAAETIMVEGQYYEWLNPADLNFYADMAITVADVIGIHTLIQSLWGLMSEYSRDIDVITSESVHILASQRYRMVSSLLDYWMAEYNRRAAALNIGLERLEVLTLRRVSRTTNRYVPIYRHREVGDYGPLERIWPPIDDGVINLEEEDDDLRTDVLVEGEPPPGYLTTGYY